MVAVVAEVAEWRRRQWPAVVGAGECVRWCWLGGGCRGGGGGGGDASNGGVCGVKAVAVVEVAVA